MGTRQRSPVADAEERVRRLGRYWQPATGTEDEVRSDPGPEPERKRLVLGPWSGSAVRGLVLLLGVALAVAGYWAWSGRPRAVTPTPIASGPQSPAPAARSAGTAPAAEASAGTAPAAPSASTAPAAPPAVVVHVMGHVRRPGLVELAPGSRVADAIAAAGGVSDPAAADTVNLARLVVDGEQIAVAVPATDDGPAEGTAGAIVDLNAADAAALDALPGIGPVLAGRIVAWRDANGPFRSVDELAEVSGIGGAILGQLRPLVRV